jgi:prepilin-type N-terminal cleavage/methylation domain-containing protein
MNKQKGFTLIELLIVIAVIAIIAAVVFVALDPLTRFQDARDSQRWSDVNAVLSAIKVDQVDNGGSYLVDVATTTAATPYMIGTCAAGGDTCVAVTTGAACVDLTALVTEGYLGSVPTDPNGGTASVTGYYLTRSANGIIEIGSCAPEGGSAISVSR